MPESPAETPVLHEWYIEVMLGTVSCTVFAATEDEATRLADDALRDKAYNSVGDATWFVSDEGECEDEDAEAGVDYV